MMKKFFALLFLLTSVKCHGAIITVTNTNNAGAGSLRAAITAAVSGDTIDFSIPGAPPHIINCTSALPPLTQSITINGGVGAPTVVVHGFGSGTGFLIAGGANVAIKNLVIDHWTIGIQVGAPGGIPGRATIQGCFIGTDSTGTVAVPNTTGIRILESPSVLIGGPLAADENVISGNSGAGILIQSAELGTYTIQGNLIGVDSTGAVALHNHIGIAYENNASNNLIEQNVISGNSSDGIHVTHAFHNNTIQGNFIGTDVTGTHILGNGGFGINFTLDSVATGNLIGGTGTGQANVIENNALGGVTIVNGSSATNSILQDSIFNNGASGIILSNGANAGQLPPTLTQASKCINSTNILFTAPTYPPLTTFRIEGFANNVNRNGAGITEGQFFLGSTTGVNPGQTEVLTATPAPASAHFISATATSALGNTSPFSNNIPLATAAATLSASATKFCNVSSATVNLIVNFSGFLKSPIQLFFSDGMSFTATTSPFTRPGVIVTAPGEIFSVLLLDATGCAAETNPVHIIVDPGTDVTLTSSSTSICEGTNISLTTDFSGGVSPFTLRLLQGATVIATRTAATSPVTFAGIKPPVGTSTYSVVLTDANGCVNASNTVTVDAIPSPIVTLTNIAQTNKTATIQAHITAATPFTVHFPNGTTRVFTTSPVTTNFVVTISDNLPSQTFAVTVTDGNNCTTTAHITVTQMKPKPKALKVKLKACQCSSGEGDRLIATIEGGKPPFRVEFSNGRKKTRSKRTVTTIVRPKRSTTFFVDVTSSDGRKGRSNDVFIKVCRRRICSNLPLCK